MFGYMARLDYRDSMPSGMEEYLGMYGWHFSKRMCEWASSRMYRIVDGRKEYIQVYTKEELERLLNDNLVRIDASLIYDALYVANMCRADYYGRSVPDERHLVRYVEDAINDPDAYDGMVFTRFYSDCIGGGVPIQWENMI